MWPHAGWQAGQHYAYDLYDLLIKVDSNKNGAFMQGKARISASSSPKVEYSGTICQVVKAISNVTHGGQTLMDTATMTQLERSREKILSEFLVHRPGVSTSDKCDR